MNHIDGIWVPGVWVFAKGILAQRVKLKPFMVAEVHKSSIKFKDLK